MNARKFVIETVFAEDGTVLRSPQAAKEYFSLAEVEAERAAAFALGRAEAVAEAARRQAAAIEAFAAAARAVLDAYQGEARVLREEAAGLALAAARAIAGVALDRFGEDRVRATLEEALEALRAAPRLTLRLPPEHAEKLEAELRATAAAHGFDGALLIKPDPAQRPGDLALDWGEGGLALDREGALARVETIVQRALASAE